MSRLLPPLLLALLPAAFAAPVPRDATPEFGSGGLLSRADLERVRFDSQRVKDGERAALVGDEKEEAEPKAGDPPRPKNRYDVAVHMPRTKFREGDPVPAYFVLRNNRGTMLGLSSRIDFAAPRLMAHGEDSDFDVRDRKTGESIVAEYGASTHCGGGYLVEVPADGYYVTRADLTRIVKALPPGEYEVEWRYRLLRSAPVHFSVVARNPTDAKPVPAAKRPAPRFYAVPPESEDEGYLLPVDPGAMAAALAVGPDGAYVPDVHTVPSADKLVEASAVWKPYRDGDRLAVTLRSASPTRPVAFSEATHLYLQIEAPGDVWADTPAVEETKQPADAKSRELTTPLAVEVRLPTDWRNRVGLSGSLHVAVLVTSKRLELPVGRGIERLQAARELKVGDGRERPPVWAGVLRTEPSELRFPPAALPLRRVRYVSPDELHFLTAR